MEYDFDSIEILKPNHGAEQLTLPEKCVFAFLGNTIDTYAAEMGATVAEHFETITKTYPIYVIKMECAALAACTKKRGATFGQILYTADSLANAERHYDRDWGKDSLRKALELCVEVLRMW